MDLNLGESQEVTLAGGKKVTVKLLDLKEQRDSPRSGPEGGGEGGGRWERGDARLGQLSAAGDGRRRCRSIARSRGAIAERGAKTTGGRDPGAWTRTPACGSGRRASPLMNPGTFIYPRSSAGSPAARRWPTSRSTSMAASSPATAQDLLPLRPRHRRRRGAGRGRRRHRRPGRLAPARRCCPATRTRPSRRATTWSTCSTSAAGTIATATCTRSPRASSPARQVKMGQTLGLLGKEGGSGGWSHLHFDISGRQPSGKWGIIEGYAFLWEAYLREHKPKLLAVARPHHFVAGRREGRRSTAAARGRPRARSRRTSGPSPTARRRPAPTVERTYAKPGVYSEMLKVTDSDGPGRLRLRGRQRRRQGPPGAAAAVDPRRLLRRRSASSRATRSRSWCARSARPTARRPGTSATAARRSTVQSDGNVVQLAKDGYAATVHRFEKPGIYLVRVSRTNKQGFTATAHLKVFIEGER